MLTKFKHLGRSALTSLKGKIPTPKEVQYGFWRKKTNQLLHSFALAGERFFHGTVLVDAMWDNPNYWIRYSMIRRALGLTSAREIGVIGPYRRKEQLGTLSRFGIKEIADYVELGGSGNEHLCNAKKLCGFLKKPEDVLKLSLPHDIPAGFLYDYILKKQKSAFVKVDDPALVDYLSDYFGYISASERIFKMFDIDLLFLSHTESIYTPLFWLALRKNKKVILPWGNGGVFLFWQVKEPSMLCNFMPSPTYKMFLETSARQKQALQKVGAECLEKRLSGTSDDHSAIWAYRKRTGHIDRKQICSEFNWDYNKKIVAVYASVWFDYPHATGMREFCDFYDWITSILNVAKQNKKVNWLFKGHPCDQWYGGVTLEDVISLKSLDHIKLAGKEWQGLAMLKAVDAVITHHGTVGLEATSIGRPVMVAEKSWYDGWGFVKCPESRQDYLSLLGQEWWRGMDVKKNVELAQIFAGWYWGRPAWQNNFLLRDDSDQWEIYKTIPDLLANNKQAIDKEMETIRRWFESDYQHYHVYKMMQTSEYIA